MNSPGKKSGSGAGAGGGDGGVAAVWAVVGSEPFLQVRAVREVIRGLPAGVQRIDADGETAELADVLDELRTFSMFSPGKCVVVREADEFVKRFRPEMERYVAEPASGSTLVLRMKSLPGTQKIAKIIAKTGKIVEVEGPKDAMLPQWIIRHAAEGHGLTLNQEAARALAELVGNDLGRLDTEIGKLAVVVEGTTVTAQDVMGSVSFQREQEMYELTNELAMGRPTEALARWRKLMAGDPSAEFRGTTWLTMWLEDLGQLIAAGRGGLPRGSKVGWRYGDRLPKFQQVAQKLGRGGYSFALKALAEADYQGKTGVGDMGENIERFLLELGGADVNRVAARRVAWRRERSAVSRSGRGAVKHRGVANNRGAGTLNPSR